MPRVRVDSQGRITIRRDICEQLRIKPGDDLEIRIEEARLILTPVKKHSILEFRGAFRVKEAKDLKEEREIAWSEQTRRLRGLPAEVWADVDAGEHLRGERDAWENEGPR